ncbi:MAG: hypothetical protein E7054_09625 [Lentisphaerae bacterium]|nr:hypothetical protein [Lentisphaerota bacterium]
MRSTVPQNSNKENHIMNPRIQRFAAVLITASTLGLPFALQAGDKVQKITFIEDDAQKNMASKIYHLKHVKAADVAPFVRSAALRYTGDSHVSSVEDTARKRQMLIVSTGINLFPYMDKLIAALDRKASIAKATNITGDGIAVGIYNASYRATQSMLDIIVKGEVSSGDKDSSVKLDEGHNIFYFKDTPATVEDIKSKLAWLDKPAPQVRLDMTVYEVRDSDLKDIGIDYLAWKNGPGLDIFGAGYKSLRVSTTERFIRSLVGRGVDLVGNASWGFGGFYTAPAFDMSFIRILQQNGKATISSSASFLVSNTAGKIFEASFAPEYQNITKNADHTSAVKATEDNDEFTSNYQLTAMVYNAVITAGKDGCINFGYHLVNSNVVERNNQGVELTEKENFYSSTSLAFDKEQLLTSWNRTSNVEQTIGVPFLCELPILKYIFGTTTSNTEITRFFVTVRATPVVYNSNMDPGVVAEFDQVTKK